MKQNNLAIYADNNLAPEERKTRALELHKKATSSILEHLYILKEINDNKFFMELGFETIADYCRSTWDYAKSTVSEYLKVANKLLPVISVSSNNNNISSSNQFDASNFSYLPMRKLVVLSKLNQSQLNYLIKNGKIHLGSRTFTTEDFNEMDYNSLKSLVKGEKRVAIKKERTGDGSVPFEVATKRIDKYINLILHDIHNCPLFGESDQRLMEGYCVRIIKVYEKYDNALSQME